MKTLYIVNVLKADGFLLSGHYYVAGSGATFASANVAGEVTEL